MKQTDRTLISDYKWLIRHAIAQRTPFPIRKWVMSKYHWFFLRWDKLMDLVRLSITWRGQKPRIYFTLYKAKLHPSWQFYASYPPLRYAPFPIAELCHWVNYAPEHPTKPFVAECEHILALAGDITNWQTGLQHVDRINRLVEQDECRFVFTYSAGLVKHSKRYLHSDLWPKFGYIYQVYPSQPDHERPPDKPFTILTIASRFSDKGVPEALHAFEILRQRHGKNVQMKLVSQALPAGYRIPEGVIHYNTPRMSDQLKAHVYTTSHVLFIPCYSDTTVCFLEACAFGVPIVTTRIHHGDEFVREGVTGHLIIPPVYSYSEHYGTRWKTWEGFLADLDAMRERGDLKRVVDQSVDRLEIMISGRAELDAMGRAARALHAEHFSPEARNRKLLRVYAAALSSETDFPD